MLFLFLSYLSLIVAQQLLQWEPCDSSPSVAYQFTPLTVSGIFGDNNVLNLTVVGNLNGSIEDVDQTTNKLSTLFVKVNALHFQTFSSASRFCSSVVDTTTFEPRSCPLSSGPLAFNVSIPLRSHFNLATLITTLNFVGGGENAPVIGCLQVSVTPEFGEELALALTFVPLAILFLVWTKSVFVGRYNPWTGTSDIIRFSTNAGVHTHALRLLTPGISDVLFYLQFATVMGMLSLDYPQFYQPVLSRTSWSDLMFKMPKKKNPTSASPSGIIAVGNVTEYGLTRYAKLAGLEAKEVFPWFMIWWLALLGIVTFLTEIAILGKSIWAYSSGHHDQDLQRKHFPFLKGMMLRTLYFFFLPLSLFTCYQLIEESVSPVFNKIFAVLSIVFLVIILPIYIINTMVRVHPRLSLSEDFHYLLTFGPLYNTYREPAVFFSTVILVTQLARGAIVGALQTSGITQVILLIVLEVVFLFSLLTWHPHPSISGMNGFNTFLSVCRLLVSLLSTIFIPQLSLSDAAKQWIGYIILVIHAIVLIFGFFLSTVQVFVEMVARLAGAGDEALIGIGRVFGIRQLRKRNDTAIMSQFHQTEARMLLHGLATPSTVFSQSHRSSNSRENYRTAKRGRIQSTASATSRPWSLTAEDVAIQIEELELELAGPNPKVNYAAREADVWKRQSEPLSPEQAGRVRRLGTRPAGPSGAAPTAKGLFSLILQRVKKKKKEQSGFQVVRSRANGTESSSPPPVIPTPEFSHGEIQVPSLRDSEEQNPPNEIRKEQEQSSPRASLPPCRVESRSTEVVEVGSDEGRNLSSALARWIVD